MNDQTDAGAQNNNIGRLILILALAIAVIAIGTAIWRDKSGDQNIDTKTAQNSSPQNAPNISEVITRLEKKLQENPNDADGWRMLGWSFLETQRFAEAATALKRATSLDSSKSEYWSMLGEALVKAGTGQKMPADAVEAFEKAVAIDPKDSRARYFLAVAKDMAGNRKAAINDWLALLSETPSNMAYAQDIERVIIQVAGLEKIDVSDRLAKAKASASALTVATGSSPHGSGAAVATAAIPGPNRAQMQSAASLPKAQQDAMIADMVDGLEARLNKDPNDANGWIMLIRSRMQLGEPTKAKKAAADGLKAFSADEKERKRIEEAAKTLGVLSR